MWVHLTEVQLCIKVFSLNTSKGTLVSTLNLGPNHSNLQLELNFSKIKYVVVGNMLVRRQMMFYFPYLGKGEIEGEPKICYFDRDLK